MTQLGPARTADELRDGLREYLASTDCDPERRFASFRAYALIRIAEDPTQARRFAVSTNTYIRHFGSWMHALADDGVRGLDDVSFETFARLVSKTKKRPQRRVGGDRDAAQVAERELLRWWLRDFGAWAHENRVPATLQDFEEYRLANLRIAYEDREPTYVPALFSIISFLWVVHRRSPRRGRHRCRGSDATTHSPRRGLSPERTAWWVREALAELAESLSIRTYASWRSREIETRGCCIPTSVTVISQALEQSPSKTPLRVPSLSKSPSCPRSTGRRVVHARVLHTGPR